MQPFLVAKVSTVQWFMMVYLRLGLFSRHQKKCFVHRCENHSSTGFNHSFRCQWTASHSRHLAEAGFHVDHLFDLRKRPASEHGWTAGHQGSTPLQIDHWPFTQPGYDIHSLPWKDPQFIMGKPSISIGHLYHGELLVITRG